MFLGYARAGWMGALAAGVCFVGPGFVVMLTLTLLSTRFAAVSTLRGAFYGLAPVVLGIFAIAVYRLGRAAIKDGGQLAFAVASAIAMAFPRVGIVTVVLVAGSVAIMLYASRAWGAVLVAATLALGLLLALTSDVAMPLALDSGTGLGALALFFVIAGAFTFGGGLAMLGFIEQHAVTSFHWLTAQEFLDGLALGQLTPGPVVMLAAFVGYHVAAITGAVVAAAAVFLPAFALVLLTIPILQRNASAPVAPGGAARREPRRDCGHRGRAAQDGAGGDARSAARRARGRHRARDAAVVDQPAAAHLRRRRARSRARGR
jgi:chromate transporter